MHRGHISNLPRNVAAVSTTETMWAGSIQ
jgi:hypothetical protein